MTAINPALWQPADGISLEENADFAVRSDKNLLVSAGPGSGKTEMLAQKAAFLLSTQKEPVRRKILAISFKKDAAANLFDRVVLRCGEEGRRWFVSRTYDAFAKSILDHFRLALPEELRPRANYRLGNEAGALGVLSAIGLRNWQSETLAEYVRSLDFRSVKRQSSLKNDDLIVWRALANGVDDQGPYLTYQMVMRLATHIVQCNRMIREAIRCAFSHVMLDEFQDTTDAQYDLLNACFSGRTGGITAVGDEDQRIMEWAGANPEIFDHFCEDYKAIRKNLICNHRSLPRIVRIQREISQRLHGTAGQKVEGDVDFGVDSGVVKLIESDDELLEAERVANEIRQDLQGGLKPREIGLLCRMRVDNFLGPIKKALSAVGVEVRDESSLQDLLKAPLIRLFLDVFSLSLDKNQGRVRNGLNSLLMELRGVNPENHKEVRKCIDNVAVLVRECAQIVKNPVDSGQFRSLVGLIMQCFGKDKVQQHFDEYKEVDKFSQQTKEFYYNFESLLNSTKGSFSAAFRKFTGEDVVPLMTIHKSKGLEFESVYFLGLEDRKFFKMHESPDAETRTFYVALSRAKRKLVFTYCAKRYLQLQSHDEISPLYDVLKTSGIAEIVRCSYRNDCPA